EVPAEVQKSGTVVVMAGLEGRQGVVMHRLELLAHRLEHQDQAGNRQVSAEIRLHGSLQYCLHVVSCSRTLAGMAGRHPGELPGYQPTTPDWAWNGGAPGRPGDRSEPLSRPEW